MFVDRTNGDSIRDLGGGRYELRITHEDGKVVTNVATLQNLALGSISASVATTDSRTIDYSYTLTNRDSSTQDILDLRIALPDVNCLTGTRDAEGWRFLRVEPRHPGHLDDDASWLPLGGTPLLPPGHRIRGLSLISLYLPGLTHASFKSVPPKIFEPDLTAELPDHVLTYLDELGAQHATHPALTIGPMIPPPGTDLGKRAEVIRRLLSEVPLAIDAGFVTADSGEVVRRLLQQAREDIGSREALARLAAAMVRLARGDDGYLSGLAVALRVLAATSAESETSTPN